MKNRIYIVIFHVVGILVTLILSLFQYDLSSYISLPFLEEISELLTVYENFYASITLVFIVVAILTIINTKYKKNKLLIPKYILTFLVSCCVSYMLFRYFFAIQWAIMIGIYGY